MARVLLRGFKVRSNQKYRLRARKQRNSRNSEQNYKLKETYRPVGRVHKTKARRGGGRGYIKGYIVDTLLDYKFMQIALCCIDHLLMHLRTSA